MSEIRYDIVGDASRYVTTVTRAAMASEAFDEALRAATRGQVGFNAATGRYVNEANKRISATEALNRLGVQTTAQVRREVQLLDELIRRHQNDAVAVAQLTRQKEQLSQSLQTGARGVGVSNAALMQWGYTVSDASQFAYGFDQGVRAIANNLPMLIQGINGTGRAVQFLARNAGWIGLAISAATTAIALFSSKQKDAKESTDGLNEAIRAQRDAIRGLISVELPDVMAKMTPSELLAVRGNLPGLISEIEAEMRRLDQASATPEQLLELERLRKQRFALVDLKAVLASVATEYDRNTAARRAAAAAGIDLDEKSAESAAGAAAETDRYTAALAAAREELARIEKLGPDWIAMMERETAAVQAQAEALLEAARAGRAVEATRIDAIGPVRSSASMTPGELDANPAGPGGATGLTDDEVERINRTEQAAAALANTLENGLANAAYGVAEAFGAMAAGTGGFDAVGRAAIGAFADMAIGVGKIAVATGIAVSGIKAALETLNPAAAIAGGLALIAIGSAVKSSLAAQASGGTSAAGMAARATYSGVHYPSGGASSTSSPGPRLWSGDPRHPGSTRENRTMERLSAAVEDLSRRGVPVTGELKERQGALSATLRRQSYRNSMLSISR